MEGDVPMSQPFPDDEAHEVELCPQCETDPCLCEDEQEASPPPLRRSHATASTGSGYPQKRPLSGKRPMAPPPRRHYEPEGDAPDLFDYFSDFDLSPMEVVGVCRTFANYLCAQEKPRQKEKRSKKLY